MLDGRVGAPAEATGGSLEVSVGWDLLGRVVDGLGVPLDDGPPLDGLERVTPDGTSGGTRHSWRRYDSSRRISM